jgi:hypothetical protein
VITGTPLANKIVVLVEQLYARQLFSCVIDHCFPYQAGVKKNFIRLIVCGAVVAGYFSLGAIAKDEVNMVDIFNVRDAD